MPAGGFAVTRAMVVVVAISMALVVLTPVAALAAAVWFVFFYMKVTVAQFFAVCLLMLALRFMYGVIDNLRSDPPSAG